MKPFIVAALLLGAMVFILLLALSLYFEYYEYKIEADKRRYPPISNERTIGSLCSETDSASVKRAETHPRGPTGGWGKEGRLDLSRTADVPTNSFQNLRNIAGFVKFETEGVLKARSYDDVYGAVYCGWSPNTVAYSPQDKAVYLRMSDCGVGDRGLSQVTEICFFPKGQKEGRIVYSTAHTRPTAGDEYLFYEKEDIGNLFDHGSVKRYYHSDTDAARILQSLLNAGRRTEAHELVLETLKYFEHLSGATEGTSDKHIPPKEFHAGKWKSFLLLKAGFEIFDPSAIAALDEAAELKAFSRNSLDEYDTYFIPFYQWFVSSLQGEKRHLAPPPQSNHIFSNDAEFIYKLLTDPGLTETTLKTSGYYVRPSTFRLGHAKSYFWFGVRSYLAKDYGNAERNLRNYLANQNGGTLEFETIATLTLLERIK